MAASISISSATAPKPEPRMMPAFGGPRNRPRMNFADSSIWGASFNTGMFSRRSRKRVLRHTMKRDFLLQNCSVLRHAQRKKDGKTRKLALEVLQNALHIANDCDRVLDPVAPHISITPPAARKPS
jgi:hypothetical protein